MASFVAWLVDHFTGEPLNARTIAERAVAAGWKTDGRTPHATLYVAMIREIAAKGKDARFRSNTAQALGGVAIGAIVVAGWYVSGHLGYGEHPETMEQVFFATNTRALESMSFVGPTAWALELLLLWTDSSLHLSFGIATLIGVVAGSAAVALLTGKFRWEGFANFTDLRQLLIGAVLMGFGGVTALGCTVGQGLSGISTLAIGSFIAVAGIVAGSVAWLKYTLWREENS